MRTGSQSFGNLILEEAMPKCNSQATYTFHLHLDGNDAQQCHKCSSIAAKKLRLQPFLEAGAEFGDG